MPRLATSDGATIAPSMHVHSCYRQHMHSLPQWSLRLCFASNRNVLQVNFETAMVLKDVFTGGKRSFQTEGHAREFRAQLYQNHGLQVPASRKSGTVPPKV